MAQAEVILPLGKYLRDLVDPVIAQMCCLGTVIPAGVMVRGLTRDDEETAVSAVKDDRTQPFEFIAATVFEIGGPAFPGA